jgi:predicted DNA-binding transcriptional regulator AlpA
MTKRQKSHNPDTPFASLETPAHLLDVVGAARWLGVSRTKLFELMQEEDFPVMRFTERVVRFDPNSLYRWALKRQKAPLEL